MRPLNTGTIRPSYMATRGLVTSRCQKYFLSLSVRYSVIADSRMPCWLSRPQTFFFNARCQHVDKTRDACGRPPSWKIQMAISPQPVSRSTSC